MQCCVVAFELLSSSCYKKNTQNHPRIKQYIVISLGRPDKMIANAFCLGAERFILLQIFKTGLTKCIL